MSDPERIVRQLDSSLQRLGVDAVELYLAHDFDPDVALYDTFGAFDELVDAGKIRAYGVSNFGGVELWAALRAGAPDAIQNSHSLLARDDARDVLPLSERYQLAYLAFGPLSGGWLTGKYRRGEPFPTGSRMTQRPEPYRGLVSEATFSAVEALGAVTAELGLSLAGLSLAWLLADERVTQIVVGPAAPEHLDPVRDALEHPVAAEDLERVGTIFAAFA